jgi:hypothetical protein
VQRGHKTVNKIGDGIRYLSKHPASKRINQRRANLRKVCAAKNGIGEAIRCVCDSTSLSEMPSPMPAEICFPTCSRMTVDGLLIPKTP